MARRIRLLEDALRRGTAAPRVVAWRNCAQLGDDVHPEQDHHCSCFCVIEMLAVERDVKNGNLNSAYDCNDDTDERIVMLSCRSCSCSISCSWFEMPYLGTSFLHCFFRVLYSNRFARLLFPRRSPGNEFRGQ